MALAFVPSGVCKNGIHLRGLYADKVVQVDSYLKIPSRRAWTTVTSAVAEALFARQCWLGRRGRAYYGQRSEASRAGGAPDTR
jgi:hypothetical protein